jgi:nucleolar MIF4G domain-containing protein 1
MADLIGPGGKGLKRSRAGQEEDDSDDPVDMDGEEVSADSDDSLDVGDEESDASLEGPDESEESGGKDDTPHDRVENDGQESGSVTATKYIPPHLRAAQLEEKVKSDAKKVGDLRRLERNVQGSLNK